MADDLERVRNHLARYCHVVDRENADTIAGLFWDDAVLDFNGRHEGAAAIRRCYADWIAAMREPVVGLRHLIYAPAIELDGDSATAETYFDADGHSRKRGTPIRLRGLYSDRLSRRDGHWRFAEREIRLFEPLD